MSISAINAVRHMDVRPSGRKFVLMALSDFADEAGECFPSVQTLARYTAQGDKTVRDHLQALQLAGIITRIRTRNSAGQLGQYRYRLHLDVAAQHGASTNKPPADFASGEKQPEPPADFAGHNHHTTSNEVVTNRGITIEVIDADTPKARGKRLDPDWLLPAAWGKWAADNTELTTEDINHEADTFRDHWIAKPGRDGVKTDWFATWRNWCRKAVKFKGQGSANKGRASTVTRRNAWLEAVNEAERGG